LRRKPGYVAAPELTVENQALATGAYRDSGNDRDPAVRQFPPLRSPHSGVPFLDPRGKVRIHGSQPGRSAWPKIVTSKSGLRLGWARLRLEPRAAELLYTTPHLGSVREFSTRGLKSATASWSKVERQWMKREDRVPTKDLSPFEYEVVSAAHSDRGYEYNVRVCVRHGDAFECPPSAACTGFTGGTNWAPPRPTRVQHTN
jgi:hypothetical protein